MGWTGRLSSRGLRASFGTVDSFAQGSSPNPVARRSLLLASELLDDVQNPGLFIDPSQDGLQTEERVLGTMVLKCMHAPPFRGTAARIPPTQFCADATSGNIRLIEGRSQKVVRNQPAVFAGTQVDVDTYISWGGIQAITGHIEQMKSFDPTTSSVTLKKPDPNEISKVPPPGEPIPGGVLAGKKIGGSTPTYPVIARQGRIQGTVTLAAVITKEGKIDHLFPITSPHPTLTEAAIDAVKAWTYTPYLLNGNPTEVSTTISVNFNLN